MFFLCFCCGVTGDVIDLVAGLFSLSSYKSAQKMVKDLGIGPGKSPDGMPDGKRKNREFEI